MWLFYFLLAATLQAEIHTMTLKQAIDLSLTQNPDLALARLDELTAQHAVGLAKDPFTPRISVGSGLAYSSGFPMSIEGSAPSIVQAHASQYIFNRPQSYVVAQARENARGAALGTAAKRDEVTFRVVSLYLDAERAARNGALAQKELESLQKVTETVQAAVSEGRELPLAGRRAEYNVAHARQIVEALDSERAAAETNLAIALGMTANDRVRPAEGDRAPAPLPASEEEAIQTALDVNKELKRLQSQMAAKGLEIRGERSARLPRVDLVAQYGLFARYNHYEDYYRTFQRHNGQIGVSLQLPVLPGPGVSAQVGQTQTEVARLRIEYNSARNRIANDLRQSYRDVHKAETAREVARLDLEVAREQLSVHLAQLQEGRVSLRQVEESRAVESSKWITFYDAQYAVERARWAVLRQTGDLVASVQR